MFSFLFIFDSPLLYLLSLLTQWLTFSVFFFSLLYCTQGGIDSRESRTTVRKKIIRMKDQLPTMTEMLERVDAEEDLEKTDGVIENLVAEVQSILLACFKMTMLLYCD